MIVKLFDKSIVISDTNQYEKIEADNYVVMYNGITAGIYMLDIDYPIGKDFLTIRSNNLAVIDYRKINERN